MKKFTASSLLLILTAISFVLTPSFALGAAKTWLGTTTDWGTASNWSPSGVPTSADDATIPGSPSGGNFPILGSGTFAARTLTMNSGATVTQTGGTLGITGAFTISSNATY